MAAGCATGADAGGGIDGVAIAWGGDFMFLTRGSAEFALVYGPPIFAVAIPGAEEGCTAGWEGVFAMAANADKIDAASGGFVPAGVESIGKLGFKFGYSGYQRRLWERLLLAAAAAVVVVVGVFRSVLWMSLLIFLGIP